MWKDYEKVRKVILSCENWYQLQGAYTMVELFWDKWRTYLDLMDMSEKQFDKIVET